MTKDPSRYSSYTMSHLHKDLLDCWFDVAKLLEHLMEESKIQELMARKKTTKLLIRLFEGLATNGRTISRKEFASLPTHFQKLLADVRLSDVNMPVSTSAPIRPFQNISKRISDQQEQMKPHVVPMKQRNDEGTDVDMSDNDEEFKDAIENLAENADNNEEKDETMGNEADKAELDVKGT